MVFFKVGRVDYKVKNMNHEICLKRFISQVSYSQLAFNVHDLNYITQKTA
jgi:hypothetical protein